MFFGVVIPRAGTSLVLASLTAALLASVALAGGAATAPVPLKTIAERHVLAALGRNWRPSRLKGFVNARTRVPFDNVQAKCRRQPARTAWPARFICVVRPRDRQSRIRLYLKYVGHRDGSFHVHWVDLRTVPAS
jgi:hypothetical protein